MTIIKIERVVVSPDGEEFTSLGAMARHDYQKSLGRERTKVKIRRKVSPPDNVDDEGDLGGAA